jgi:hypothetical protein
MRRASAGYLRPFHHCTLKGGAPTVSTSPMERVAALAEAYRQTLATPTIGEVLTVGAPPFNVQWWKGLK